MSEATLKPALAAPASGYPPWQRLRDALPPRTVCGLAVLVSLLIPALLPWFPMPMDRTWFSRVYGVIFSLTEPVMRPFRNLLPPVRFGAVALDLSPIILFIILAIVRSYVCRVV